MRHAARVSGPFGSSSADTISSPTPNPAYRVVKDKIGQWLIVCDINGYTIGLTWMDGVTVNGRPDEFYVAESVLDKPSS